MRKIFILCSGLILAPSMGWADVCSGGHTSLPSGAQLQTTMGSSTSASPSLCENSCYSACSSTIANSTSVRESLGCDE